MNDTEKQSIPTPAIATHRLVACHVDISGEYTDAEHPLGLAALVDLDDIGRVPGSWAMPAVYFPRESADLIVSRSTDPMMGDDELAWVDDSIVYAEDLEGGGEEPHAVHPVTLDGEPYWRVGAEYLWEVTEGPDEVLELLDEARNGEDLKNLAERVSSDRPNIAVEKVIAVQER